MQNGQRKAKYWLLTINDTSESDWGLQLADLWFTGLFRYIIGQLERAPTTRRLHIQIAGLTKDQFRITELDKRLPQQCHLTPVLRDNGIFDYASKSDTRVDGPLDFGIKPVGKSHTDWEAIRDLAKQNRLDEIPGDIYIRYFSNLRNIAAQHTRPQAKGSCRGVWIWGEPGAGKSWFARLIAHQLVDPTSFDGAKLVTEDVRFISKITGYKEDDRIPYLKQGNKWWTGYQGQKVAILDDFEVDWKHLGHYIKIWGDRYGLLEETKGSGIGVAIDWIVITSNYPIDGIWDSQTICSAIDRRYIQIELNKN